MRAAQILDDVDVILFEAKWTRAERLAVVLLDAGLVLDPVGAVEIAERLDVARSTVDSWRQRDSGFPEPRRTVGGRPAWDWSDVTGWVRARPNTRGGRDLRAALDAYETREGS